MTEADTKRLDFLQTLNNKCIWTGLAKLRMSTTGRGWRLHEHTSGYKDIRDAIDELMDQVKEGENDE